MRDAGLLFVMAVSVTAAQSSSSKPAGGSIQGTVTDLATRTAVPRATVFVVTDARSANGGGVTSAGSERVTASTDDRGRYALTDLPLGHHLVFAGLNGTYLQKPVTLTSGQEQASLDFQIATGGSVSGAVIDQDGEPAPHLRMYLIAREYQGGVLRYVVADHARTDDKGAYRLSRGEPGREYLVLASPGRPVDAISSEPINPKLRKPVIAPTYYPSAPNIDGAATIDLPADGHAVEGVDIHIRALRSYGVEGTLEVAGVPSALMFSIADERLSGESVAGYAGVTGPDGKIRICGLPVGGYRLTATRSSSRPVAGAPQTGSTVVVITDSDVRGIELSASSGLPLSGKVIWDGDPPDKPGGAHAAVSLYPLDRLKFMGEVLDFRPPVPGDFRVPSLTIGEYSITALVSTPGMYVKDVRYAGIGILNCSLMFGGAMANSQLQVLVAHDGATITAAVADRDGNPIPFANVVVVAAGTSSETEFASALSWGQADQTGVYTSPALAPGKYRVLATDAPLSRAYESVNRLWNARARASDIELGAGQNVQVKLDPTDLQ